MFACVPCHSSKIIRFLFFFYVNAEADFCIHCRVGHHFVGQINVQARMTVADFRLTAALSEVINYSGVIQCSAK